MTWQNPWMLVLLGLLPLIWWRWVVRSPHAAVRFSTLGWLKQQGRGLRVRSRHVIPLLRTLAVGLLVVCVAGPRKGNEETRIYSEGIAIQLVVDRSSSMLAMDFTIEGRPVDRLAAVKKVIREFILGSDELDGRPDDLIGMVSFAGFADSNCPLTLDHAYLLETLEHVQIVEERSEDGTAIGDAIAVAVERLRDLDRRKDVLEANRVKSKVIILLTDGENNVGDLLPHKAAEMAKAFDIKIHTIGAGTTGTALIPVVDVFGLKRMHPQPVTVDEETLKRVASITDGRFWRATDTNSLREIYADIDKLEKTETEEKRYMQYSEMATEPVEWGGWRWPALLSVVFGLLAAEVLVANTVLRKVP